MGRYLIVSGFLLLFGAVTYLGAVVTQQQRAIDALVSDQAVSLDLQTKLSRDIQKLRQQVEQSR